MYGSICRHGSYPLELSQTTKRRFKAFKASTLTEIPQDGQNVSTRLTVAYKGIVAMYTHRKYPMTGESKEETSHRARNSRLLGLSTECYLVAHNCIIIFGIVNV